MTEKHGTTNQLISGLERTAEKRGSSLDESSMMKRSRLLYFVVDSFVVALGLASRRYATVLPVFFAQYAGDTLWAVMVFVGVGLLAPRLPSFRVAVVALAVSYSIEASQLYHAPWIDTLRHTRVGGLVLGYGFLWSDLACYTVGVALGVVVEIWVWKAAERRSFH